MADAVGCSSAFPPWCSQLRTSHRRPLSASTAPPPTAGVVEVLGSIPLGQLDELSIAKAAEIIVKKCEAKNPNYVSIADRIVRRLIDERVASGDDSPRTDDITIELVNGVLDCYRALSSITAYDSHLDRALPNQSFAKKADELLAAAEEASERIGGGNTLMPGTDSYAIVVDAYAKIGAANKAENVLKRVEPKWMNNAPPLNDDEHGIKLQPNAAIYQAILIAWARSRQSDAARKAESILETMDLLHRQGYSNVRPSTLQFNTVINALAKSGEPGAAGRAEKIIDHMMHLSKDCSAIAAPDVRSFNTALHAYAISGETGAAEKAEALLQRMEELSKRGITTKCAPNTVSYNNVLNAWASSGEKGAASRSEAILEHMMTLSEDERDVCPNSISFNACIKAWATSGEKGAAERSEALLKQMEHLCKDGKDACPDTITYSAIIHAWAISGEAGAAERAEAILNRMEKLYTAGNASVRPNTVSYSAAINAYAKSREKGAAQRAEALLMRMNDANVKPNQITYVAVIDAWAKSKEVGSAERAHDILRHQLRLCEKGRAELRPSIASFTAVVDAYATEGLAEKAEELLNEMEQLSESNPAFRHIRPNRITYNAVIKALARKREPDSAARAELILKHMMMLHKSGRRDVSPDNVSFSSCIDAYAKSKASDAFGHAQRLFNKMRELDAEGMPNMKPNKVTYNALINALAFSDHQEKAVEAQRLLHEMELSHNISPDCLTYNAVLRACAYSYAEESREALRLAMEIFEVLHVSKTIRPSYHSYDIFFNVCRKASKDDEYERLVELAFKLCTNAGLLHPKTLRSLASNARKPFFQKLVGSTGFVTLKDLPPQWSRNTRLSTRSSRGNRAHSTRKLALT